jgi:hypothetical protein
MLPKCYYCKQEKIKMSSFHCVVHYKSEVIIRLPMLTTFGDVLSNVPVSVKGRIVALEHASYTKRFENTVPPVGQIGLSVV